MRVDPFLVHRGWSRDGFVAELTNQLGVEADDTLYLTGSLVDGLGNGLSDLDAYLVTERSLDDRLTFANAIIMDFAGMTVDVEVFRPDELRRLLKEVSSYADDGAHDVRGVLTIAPRQLKVLHNLCRAEAVVRGAAAVEFPPSTVQRAVTRILFHQSLMQMTAFDLDILGTLTEGDTQSAGPLLFGYFGLLEGCLLAMNGETNPGEKWRPRLLERLRGRSPSYGLPEHTHGAVRQLFDAGYPVIEPRLAEQYRLFRRMIHAGNTIIPIGQAQFLAGGDDAKIPTPATTPVTASAAVPGGRHVRHSGGPLPELHLRTRLRYGSEGYAILNPRVDRSHCFDRPGFDLLTQFDGRTEARDAAHRLAAPVGRPPSEIEGSLSDLRSFLVHFGYV